MNLVGKSCLRALPLLFLCLNAPAAGAAPVDPVREIIDVAAGNWLAENPTAEDYFSEERLKRLYSKDFASAYREASKHPAYDLPEGETTGSPFDYDVIAGGQDGCEFKDIRVEDDGDGQVTARFNNSACMGDEPANKEDTVLIFHVQAEGGHEVVDDIFRVQNGESGQGLKQQMRDIASGG